MSGKFITDSRLSFFSHLWQHYSVISWFQEQQKTYRELHSRRLSFTPRCGNEKYVKVVRKGTHRFFVECIPCGCGVALFCGNIFSWRYWGLCPKCFWFSSRSYFACDPWSSILPSSWFLTSSLAVNSLAHHKYAQFRQEAMEVVASDPVENALSQDLPWTTAWSSLAEEKKKVACRFFYLRIEGRWSSSWGGGNVGLKRHRQSPPLSSSPFLDAEVGIAPPNGICKLSTCSSCHHHALWTCPSETARHLNQRSASKLHFASADSREKVPQLCRTELELIVLSCLPPADH